MKGFASAIMDEVVMTKNDNLCIVTHTLHTVLHVYIVVINIHQILM